MPVKGVELEVVEGITEHSSRVALKGVFQNFGDVVACWVPPIDRRHVDRASVRFGNATSAEAAKQACDSNQVFLQGLPVKVDYRMGGGRRVGNSDLGESGGQNDEGKARAIMDSAGPGGGGGGGARNKRSRSRRRPGERERRSRSRDRRRDRRSRSRDRRRRSRSGDRFGEGPVPALPPPSLSAPPPAPMPQDLLPPALPGFPGMSGLPGMLPPDAAAMAAAAAAALPDPVAEAKKKAEIAAVRAERAKQLKRGPGVAALVQGALKRATQQSVSKKPEEPAEKPKGKPQEEEVSDAESEETIRKKKEEQERKEKLEARKKKEKEEREAREREKAEREARERREQARREAAEAEKALQEKEAETREQRIKASVQAAKKQQAERTGQNPADNLYANMPGPNLEDQGANEARKEEVAAGDKANREMTNLPPEDRSKVLFLDIDGVLRPARAGGFDISDGDAAKNVDTSDFFPSAVKALRHIIERTAAKVVLSSEWRRSDPLCNALQEVFTKNRVRQWTSKTKSLDLDSKADPVRSFAERRAREITTWLQEHEREVSGWVVLDDINLGIADENRKATTRPMQPHLVQTWPLCGLTMGNAKTAVRILNGEMINKVVVERQAKPVGSGEAAAVAAAGKK